MYNHHFALCSYLSSCVFVVISEAHKDDSKYFRPYETFHQILPAAISQKDSLEFSPRVSSDHPVNQHSLRLTRQRPAEHLDLKKPPPEVPALIPFQQLRMIHPHLHLRGAPIWTRGFSRAKSVS